MGFTGLKMRRGKGRGEVVAALDIGTSKVVCFIARLDADGEPRIVGVGHQRSEGVRTGTIADMALAERTIGQAVQAAEQMTGVQVREVLVSLSGGRPVSQTIAVDVLIDGREVTEGDLKRALRGQRLPDLPAGMEIVHAIPVAFSLDGMRGIHNPLGMFGERLGVDIHLVTAQAGALRNLSTCVGRCHLEVEGFVIAPYAAGLACLSEDDLKLGCTLIDMGGGTTTVAVFFDEAMVFADCIPVGGGHVTNDIARGLTTPSHHAERMKTLFGSAIPGVGDDREMLEVPQVGDEESDRAEQVPKSLLTGIIQPRLEEVFELVRSRLEASGFDRVAGRRVVLTGGGSQLQGVCDLAQLVLDKRVRPGRPQGVQGVAEAVGGPAFSAASGLLAHAARQHPEFDPVGYGEEAASPGLFGRLGGWLREYL